MIEKKIIILDSFIDPIDKTVGKKLIDSNFKDIIVSIFHAVKLMADSEPSIWKEYYKEFLSSINKQNSKGWPHVNFIFNNGSRRIDVYFDKPFIRTTNILMLIFRLLYIENIKQSGSYRTLNYHPILSHMIFAGSHDKPFDKISDININNLLSITLTYMEYYSTVYENETSFEYQLAKVIMDQIKN